MFLVSTNDHELGGSFPSASHAGQELEKSLLPKETTTHTEENCLTQRFQFLHCFLPHGLNVDAAEAPVGGNLNEVGLLEAVWDDFIHVMGKVQQILLIDGVPPLGIKREVEKRVIKIKVVVEMPEAVFPLLLPAVALALPSISIVIVMCPLLFIGKDL